MPTTDSTNIRVFSAHAEVVPPSPGRKPEIAGILRARGGSSKSTSTDEQ